MQIDRLLKPKHMADCRRVRPTRAIDVNKKTLLKLVLTLIWTTFWYMPKINLDMHDTYTISGVIEKRNVRGGKYVIRVPNPHKNKTVFDHDLYIYPWFSYSYAQFGVNNASFCETRESLALISEQAPVQVLFARNVGGIFAKDYMVAEVKLNGHAVDCYSKNEVLKHYQELWLINFHPLSIVFFILGLLAIWYSRFYSFLKVNKDK